LNPTRVLLLAAAALALPPAEAGALPLLSEVLYDAVGSDDGSVFVEIAGVPGTDLGGYSVAGINGADGSQTVSIALVGAIPASGLFVLADEASGGGTAIPVFDQLANFDFQNGPDSVVLRLGDVVVDALGYGAFGAGDVFAGEGSPAPAAPPGSSLARRFADVDTDDNAADFVVREIPDPGQAARLAVAEPSGAALLLAGLGAAAAARRGQRRR